MSGYRKVSGSGGPARRPQLKDVARAASVSISVVSRVLNGDPSLRARRETIERVEAAAASLQYRANAAGRSLRKQSVDVIGVVLPDANSLFYAEMLRGIEAACDERELMPMVIRAERIGANSNLLTRLVREGRVDGLLVQPIDRIAAEVMEGIVRDHVPTVILVSKSQWQPGSVVFDDAAGIAVATRHLIALGHRDIGFVGGFPSHDTAPRRLSGFESAMESSGLPIRKEWVTELGYSPEDGRAAFAQIAEQEHPPTAVVIATHNAAIGFAQAARQASVDVPDDLSIVSLHDSLSAEYVTPALTTVKMPLFELGYQAVTHLAEILSGEPARDIVVTEPRPILIERESAGPPRTQSHLNPLRKTGNK
jgi:LacI family transcriptional regulator